MTQIQIYYGLQLEMESDLTKDYVKIRTVNMFIK